MYGRPRGSSVDSIRQIDEDRGPRTLAALVHDDSQASASSVQQSRSGSSLGDARRKEAVSGRSGPGRSGQGQAQQRQFHTAPAMRGSGRSLSPPPYPGGDGRDKVTIRIGRGY